MPTATDAVWIDVLPSMRRFGPELQKGATKASATAGQQSSKRFSEGFKSKLKIAGAVAGAFAAVKVKDFFQGSIREASNLTESLNAIQVSYGDAAGAVQRMGQNAARELGLSNVEFNELAVRFSAFSENIAGEGGDVAGTLEKLTGRASDFASVMNLEVSGAAQLFQSGLAGETEPLRKFGIDLSAAAVQAHAVEEGIASAGGEMSEQEKVQARYSLLMEQTNETAGDFANTSDSLANRQRIVGAQFSNLQAKVGKAFLPVLEKLMGFVSNQLLPGMERLGEIGSAAFAWARENADWLMPLAGAITGIVAALGAYVGIARAVTAVTAAWNAVLAANPIMLVVIAIAGLVAALVVAYKRSETFRAIVDAVWQGVQTAIRSVVDWFTNVAWPAIKGAYDAIAAAAMWLWNDVLKPAWEGIRLAVQVVIEAIKLYWNNILKPVFQAVASVATWLWNDVLSPVFGWIGDRWADLLRGIDRIWRNVLKPVFNAVANVAGWLWEQVLEPVFGWIGNRWDTILRGMKVVYNQVLKPIFETFGDAVDVVADAVETAVGAIGRAWDGLKRAFASPVNWVIDNVINKFLGWVNSIADDMGLSIRIDTLANVAWGSSNAPVAGSGRPGSGGLNKGGIVPGWGPDRDSVMMPLTPGEYVLNRSTVSQIGLDRLEALNRAGRSGRGLEIGGPLDFIGDIATAAINKARELIVDVARPGFDAAMGLMDRTVGQWGIPGGLAAGTARTLGDAMLDWMSGIEDEADRRTPQLGPGIGWKAMWSAVENAFPWSQLHSGYRPGAITATGNPSYHGMGRAVDLTPSMEIFNWLRDNYRDSAEIIFSPANGRQIWNGSEHMYSEPTRGDHWDHIHWAYDQGGMLPPGVSTVANWTGKPEAVLNERQWAALTEGDRSRPIQLQVDGQTMAEVMIDPLSGKVAERRRQTGGARPW